MFENLDDPRRQALLAMAAGLFSPVRGRGMSGFGEALGNGINAGLLGLNTATRTQEATRRGEMDRKLEQARLDQLKQAQEAQAYMGAGIGRFMQPGVQPATPVDDSGYAMPSSPPSFDKGGFAQYLAQNPATAREALNFIPQPEKPEYLESAGRVYQKTPNGLKPVVEAPQKDWQNPEWVKTQQAIRAAGRPQVTTNVMPPREVFKDSMALKKDFDGLPEVKGFKEVQGAWDQISTALKNPSAANDLAAATKYMKLLDPGSVVRESELMMAMQASGALDRMANYHKRLIRGEKLTPSQREDFYKSGEALYKAAQGRYDQSVGQYEELAGKYGLDADFLKPKAQAKAKDEKPAVSINGLSVTVNGQTLTFPSEAQLNAFKKRAGL